MTVVANSADERVEAKKRLPRMMFDSIDGGFYDEVTLTRNVEDLRAIALASG